MKRKSAGTGRAHARGFYALIAVLLAIQIAVSLAQVAVLRHLRAQVRSFEGMTVSTIEPHVAYVDDTVMSPLWDFFLPYSPMPESNPLLDSWSDYTTPAVVLPDSPSTTVNGLPSSAVVPSPLLPLNPAETVTTDPTNAEGPLTPFVHESAVINVETAPPAPAPSIPSTDILAVPVPTDVQSTILHPVENSAATNVVPTQPVQQEQHVPVDVPDVDKPATDVVSTPRPANGILPAFMFPVAPLWDRVVNAFSSPLPDNADHAAAPQTATDNSVPDWMEAARAGVSDVFHSFQDLVGYGWDVMFGLGTSPSSVSPVTQPDVDSSTVPEPVHQAPLPNGTGNGGVGPNANDSEICDNGIDDDGNGFIDCADGACGSDPSCPNNNGGSPSTVHSKPQL